MSAASAAIVAANGTSFDANAVDYDFKEIEASIMMWNLDEKICVMFY